MRRNRVIPADDLHPQRLVMIEALRRLQPRAGALLEAVLLIVSERSIERLATSESGPDWPGVRDCVSEIVRLGTVPPTVHRSLFSRCRFVCSSVYAHNSVDRHRDDLITVVLGGAIVAILFERGIAGYWSVDSNAEPVITAAISLGGDISTAAARSFAAMTDLADFDDVESLFLAIAACVCALASERLPISITELGVLVRSIREFEAALSANPESGRLGPPGRYLENSLAFWSPLLRRYFGNPRPEIPADLAEELKLLALLAA